MEYNRELFAKRVKMLRKEKKLTQTELGDAIGKTKGAIGHYEYGDREPPLDALYSLSNYFGVSVDYLMAITDFRNDEEAVDYMMEKLKEAGLIKHERIDKKTVDKLISYIGAIEKIRSS